MAQGKIRMEAGNRFFVQELSPADVTKTATHICAYLDGKVNAAAGTVKAAGVDVEVHKLPVSVESMAVALATAINEAQRMEGIKRFRKATGGTTSAVGETADL